MIRDKLKIDEKDIKILSFYMNNPSISQNEIAEKLDLSQPSVFVRIQKLKKKGLLETRVGLNFNKSQLFICRVDLTSNNPNDLLHEMKKCPFFVNGFIISGENNVSLLLAHENLRKIDEIVNTHLRNLETVSNIKVNVIVSSAKDYVFEMNLMCEIEGNCSEEGYCKHCGRINLEHHKR